MSVETTGDRICWLRGFVITSPTRVLSAWDLHTWMSEQHHYTAFTVEDVYVSRLPTADIFGEKNYRGFFAWFCPRRLVPNRGVASRPVHGRSEHQLFLAVAIWRCLFVFRIHSTKRLTEQGSRSSLNDFSQFQVGR